MSALAAWDLVPAPSAPVRRSRAHLQLVPALTQPAATAGARRGAVRLTRRGRLALLLIVGLALVAALATARAGLAAGAVPARTVTVQAGQTLSEIAASSLPALTIAEGVAQIQLANGMSSPQVRAGQSLVIPELP